jgi:hypothetical protein
MSSSKPLIGPLNILDIQSSTPQTYYSKECDVLSCNFAYIDTRWTGNNSSNIISIQYFDGANWNDIDMNGGAVINFSAFAGDNQFLITPNTFYKIRIKLVNVATAMNFQATLTARGE